MTFTYNPQNVTTRDKVRLLVGDVTEGNAETTLQDEEITTLEALYGTNIFRLASAAAEALAAKFLRRPEGVQTQGGSDRVIPTDRVTHLRRLADRLRRQADSGAVPYAGGISVSDKEAAAADTDRVQPAFARGQLDAEDTEDAFGAGS